MSCPKNSAIKQAIHDVLDKGHKYKKYQDGYSFSDLKAAVVRRLKLIDEDLKDMTESGHNRFAQRFSVELNKVTSSEKYAQRDNGKIHIRN